MGGNRVNPLPLGASPNNPASDNRDTPSVESITASSESADCHLVELLAMTNITLTKP